MLRYGVGSLGILFASLLLHELSHCAVAFRLGGGTREIILGPFGGLTQPHVPVTPLCDSLVAAAGPIANLIVLLSACAVLIFQGVDPRGLLNPLNPHGIVDGPQTWILWVKLTFWINWLLVLVNLLPAYPFDGNRLLKSLLWMQMDYSRSSLLVAKFSQLLAVSLALAAIFFFDEDPAEIFPMWMPLALMALFLFFGSRYEIDRIEEWSRQNPPTEAPRALDACDFPAGELATKTMSPIKRWLQYRENARTEREQAQAIEDERRLDGILDRLHNEGNESLSKKEKDLLARVSERYRHRQDR